MYFREEAEYVIVNYQILLLLDVFLENLYHLWKLNGRQSLTQKSTRLVVLLLIVQIILYLQKT